MTDLDLRPPVALEEPDTVPEPARPVSIRSLRAAIVMAAGVAVAGLVGIAALVLIAWGAEKRSSAPAGSAVRAAGQAWLFAHHSPIGTDAGTIALVPIGLFALPLGLLIWAGVQVGRDIAPCTPADAARIALAMAGTYGVIAFLVHLSVSTGPVRIGALAAVLPAIGCGFLGAGAGIWQGAGLVAGLRRRAPDWVPVSLRAAGVALGVLGAAAAVLVAAALATDGGRVVALTGDLAVGIVGGVLLLVVSILLAPNAIVCAASIAVGPGFAVGTGTGVTAHHSSLGPVPAFPLLAALPEGSHPSPLTWAVLAAPVLGGVLAGVMISRLLSPQSWRRVLLPGLATGAAAGSALGLLALAAGGPLGAGRLAAVGPSPWKVGGAFAVEIAVLATAAAACGSWRAIRWAAIERELAQLRIPKAAPAEKAERPETEPETGTETEPEPERVESVATPEEPDEPEPAVAEEPDEPEEPGQPEEPEEPGEPAPAGDPDAAGEPGEADEPEERTGPASD